MSEESDHDDDRDHDGSESSDDDPKIDPSDEMAAALAEATASVEKRAAAAAAGGGKPPVPETGNLDKLTIEMLSEELQSLKNEYESKLKELEEANDRHLRLQAEFENFRRRTLKERQETLQYGHQNLVKDLLSTVDNLDRALEHASESEGADLQGILQGVDLVRRELLGALGKHGVTEVEAAGAHFDPAVHEAMGQLPDASAAPNTVLQVLQKGYLLRDRMMRPARVIVSRAPTPDKAGGGSTE